MKATYLSYMLRLQRGPGSDHWRATLQNAHSGELLRFASEREMLRYLLQVLANPPPVADHNRVPGDCSQGGDGR